MLLVRRDQPGARTAEVDHCEDHLWNLSCNLDASLHAESTVVEDGTIKVKCSSQAFCEWVKQTVSKIPPLGDTNFTWWSLVEPKLVKALCYIPGKLRNTAEVNLQHSKAATALISRRLSMMHKTPHNSHSRAMGIEKSYPWSWRC